ncbi:DUF2516 family protein [Boudabousia marimammalium]|uniref:Uncharacterized protein n=1 Tax=Boudabousia marimammalium TaxID=156892 RepID=A0A1Q5PMD1_9ACTO|nr:DUF2516 family protein [Boudabousia marimammalium]OKL48679.1 hypothetical protein BM477_05640 [Boudabousia marimammalium]
MGVVLNTIMVTVQAVLAILLFGMMIHGAVHAAVQPSDAFIAFARRSKKFWVILLFVGAFFTWGSAAYGLMQILSLMGISVPAISIRIASSAPTLSFFGILLFVAPATYFAGDYKKVKHFKAYRKGRGQFRQRPGNPYGDSRGPRDW